MTVGAWIVIAALVLALGFGGYRAVRDGRFRRRSAPPTTSAAAASALAGTPWAEQLGDRATLVQFSSAFCAPCRATRVVLADVAGTLEGVAHLEVDAEQHLDLVRRLNILRTPTTLVLDEHGVEVGRATGAARRPHVLAALEPILR